MDNYISITINMRNIIDEPEVISDVCNLFIDDSSRLINFIRVIFEEIATTKKYNILPEILVQLFLILSNIEKKNISNFNEISEKIENILEKFFENNINTIPKDLLYKIAYCVDILAIKYNNKKFEVIEKKLVEEAINNEVRINEHTILLLKHSNPEIKNLIKEYILKILQCRNPCLIGDESYDIIMKLLECEEIQEILASNYKNLIYIVLEIIKSENLTIYHFNDFMKKLDEIVNDNIKIDDKEIIKNFVDIIVSDLTDDIYFYRDLAKIILKIQTKYIEYEKLFKHLLIYRLSNKLYELIKENKDIGKILDFISNLDMLESFIITLKINYNIGINEIIDYVLKNEETIYISFFINVINLIDENSLLNLLTNITHVSFGFVKEPNIFVRQLLKSYDKLMDIFSDEYIPFYDEMLELPQKLLKLIKELENKDEKISLLEQQIKKFIEKYNMLFKGDIDSKEELEKMVDTNKLINGIQKALNTKNCYMQFVIDLIKLLRDLGYKINVSISYDKQPVKIYI